MVVWTNVYKLENCFIDNYQTYSWILLAIAIATEFNAEAQTLLIENALRHE